MASYLRSAIARNIAPKICRTIVPETQSLFASRRVLSSFVLNRNQFSRQFSIVATPQADVNQSEGTEIGGTKASEAYVIVFTCNVCESRSAKKISKQAYHKGVVLIQCGCCKNRHLIADNLGWFEDNPVNVEDLCKRKGQEVMKSKIISKDGLQLEGINWQQ